MTLLEFVIRDEQRFFARTSRHLVLHERDSRDDAAIREAVRVAWPRLPLAKATAGGFTFAR